MRQFASELLLLSSTPIIYTIPLKTTRVCRLKDVLGGEEGEEDYGMVTAGHLLNVIAVFVEQVRAYLLVNWEEREKNVKKNKEIGKGTKEK